MIPIIRNIKAAIFCIDPVDNLLDIFFPKITAIKDDTVNAVIVPKATEKGELCSTANAIVAN